MLYYAECTLSLLGLYQTLFHYIYISGCDEQCIMGYVYCLVRDHQMFTDFHWDTLRDKNLTAHADSRVP